MQRNSTPLPHPFHVLWLKRLPFIMAMLLSSSWLIAEGPLFHIECPPDVTVDCNAELWDLSMYGNATVYGYNGPESAGPPISTEYHLNSCDVGTIVRTWVAYDYSGSPFYCSQTIYVTGSGGSVNIHWPPDYTIHSCNPQTDPEDLSPPYDYPVIYGGGGSCSQLLTNHEDLVFNINPPACVKILRKWTIIDWCEYDPNAYHPTGIWQHTQIIKVKPENPPTIVCPPDTIISSGQDCSAGYVQMPLAYGMSDCGSGVTITNHSPYAFNHGADASGNYPIGTTKVIFTADDGCGQTASCSMYITVKDLKKPTPICYYGISISLMQMPDGYYMNLRPSFFDKGSFDNCTPKSKLKMWVEPSRVDCENIGANDIRVYVEDESGNVEYCNTVVYVQDNMGMCPPSDGVIDGSVQSRSGDMLEEIKVSLTGTPTFAMTDASGHYTFSSVRFGHDYTIRPELTKDDLSGVSALDMAILLKHILGIQRLNSPYQFIAADVDKSGRVSVNDLVVLKDLILRNHLGVDAKTSWRFVDASYRFPDPFDPLTTGFPEIYQISSLTSDMTALDFIGVKLGDLNDDAVHLTSGQPILSRGAGVTIDLTDKDFKSGDVFDIVVGTGQYQDIEAMEFALSFDPGVLEVVSIVSQQQSQGLDVIDESKDHHMISTLWYGVKSLTSRQLYVIKVKALQDGRVMEAVNFASAARSEAYQIGTEQVSEINLNFTDSHADIPLQDSEAAPVMRIGQNTPNPFSNETIIPLELPEDGPVWIRLFDSAGRQLKSIEFDGVAGWQEISLDGHDIPARGVVLCQVISGYGSVTLRMVVNPDTQ